MNDDQSNVHNNIDHGSKGAHGPKGGSVGPINTGDGFMINVHDVNETELRNEHITHLTRRYVEWVCLGGGGEL